MSKNKTFSDTSANRYSLALYELANENGKLEEIEKNSSFFTSLISNNEELKLLHILMILLRNYIGFWKILKDMGHCHLQVLQGLVS